MRRRYNVAGVPEQSGSPEIADRVPDRLAFRMIASPKTASRRDRRLSATGLRAFVSLAGSRQHVLDHRIAGHFGAVDMLHGATSRDRVDQSENSSLN